MRVIRLRKKNIFVIVVVSFTSYAIIRNTIMIFEKDDELDRKSNPFVVAAWISCTREIYWFTKRFGGIDVSSPYFRSIDILGPPGSGVEWLRYIIEQLTALKTGSTVIRHPEVFAGEGYTSKVVAIMSHDVENISSQNAGIIMYRNVKDTIRTHFAELHGAGAFLEAPMQAYYGKDWSKFAISEGQKWGTRYRQYIETRSPLMIVDYSDLEDEDAIQGQLLRLSNFLRVPIRHSALQCIISHANEFPLKPKPLKSGFEPFQILSPNALLELNILENRTRISVEKSRSSYRPNV